MPPSREDARPPGVAFLLAQLGAHAAGAFAERLAPLGLTPPQAGVLRQLAASPGVNQRELAEALRMHAPRLVPLIDEMQAAGLVERERDPADRRNHVLSLTAGGRQALARVRTVARAHDRALTAALSDAERAQLADLLARLADEQGLAPGVHPGFRRLGRRGR